MKQHTAPKPKDDKGDDAKKRRIAAEKAAADPDYRPTEQDAQIDGSGARLKSDS